MFVINEDKSIYITRGDVAFFSLSVNTETGEAYKFQPGDVVRMKVFEKKACDNVVLTKDFGIEEETEEIEILLEEKDTKIGKVISKPTDYWYEVELNPYTDPQTIIGYDEDGAKIFRLYPEGNDKADEPITPEDVTVVDEELSLTSTRPVQNQAIARAIATIRADVKKEVDAELTAYDERVDTKVDTRLARFDAFLGGIEGGDGYEEYELTSEIPELSGKIISNGVCAILYITGNTYFDDATSGKIVRMCLSIPKITSPLAEGVVYMKEIDEPNCKCTVEIRGHDRPNVVSSRPNGGIDIYIHKASDGLFVLDKQIAIPYILANPYIPEVNDARFNIEGAEHETLGAAIRSLEERIKALEQKN
jgi:hypothetical protein